MRRSLLLLAVWTAVLNAADTPQYIISTYAGGAPARPTAAIALAADDRGNVYFVDGYGYTRGPARSNSVFKIAPGGVITRIAGDSRTGFSGDGGPATNAALDSPKDVAVDRSGNVLIVDAGNQRIRRVSRDGAIITVAGGGAAVLGDGGRATAGQLNYPTSIAIDAAGNLFIGELGRVRKVTPDGIITTVAGGGPNPPADGMPATAARLSSVFSVAVDTAGDLFIADSIIDPENDSYNYLIRKVAPDGTLTTLPPVAGCCFASMTADAAGNLFVPIGPSIWKISPNGTQTLVAGNGTYGPPSGDGRSATQAQLNGPTAVAVDATGNLFIADNAGRSIRVVAPDGVIRSLASIPPAAPIPSGDGGPATMAELQLAVSGLSYQSGLAVDSAGNLYIAETAAHRVRRVSPDRTITTVAGVGGPRCTGPSDCRSLGDGGPAIDAALAYPTGVVVDKAGNLYIADTGNARVRRVLPDGIITTYAGNGNAPEWNSRGVGNGGPATSAPLNVQSLAMDSTGNLLISEGNLADVRRVSPDGTLSTLLSATTAGHFLGFISAIALDRAGSLFVAGSYCDGDENCYQAVQKIAPSGDTTLILDGRTGYSLLAGANMGDGGPAIAAHIGFITNLALDNAGNLFVADLFAQRVRKVDTSGIITTVAGNGLAGYSGDGGPGTSARLLYPFGLTADDRGNIYFSDFNQAVRILRPAAQ
jgi:sugar lactone lactonase YvrE